MGMIQKRNILVVDDDPGICEVVREWLVETGYNVTTMEQGQGVIEAVAEQDIDLVILDLGLPDVDGLTLMQHLKSRFEVGLIILSGRGETSEKIVGLEVGADDYLGKPFEPRELLARVRSVLRRLQSTAPPVPVDAGPGTEAVEGYAFDRWQLNTGTLELIGQDGERVSLTSGEIVLLQVLVERPNRILSRDQLMDLIHDNDAPAFDRSIDTKIARLRKSIERDPRHPELIKTVRNRGYILAAKVTPLTKSE